MSLHIPNFIVLSLFSFSFMIIFEVLSHNVKYTHKTLSIVSDKLEKRIYQSYWMSELVNE